MEALASVWILLSSSVVLFNKYILHALDFPYPIFLTTWHLAIATIATRFLALTTTLLDGRHDVAMDWLTYMLRVFPIGLFFSLSLILYNIAYLYLSVAFIQMLKGAVPVAVLLAGVLLTGKPVSLGTFFNVVVIVGGVMVASYGEIEFSVIGFVAQAVGILCEAVRLVLVQMLLELKNMKMDPLCSLYYFAPIAKTSSLVLCLSGVVKDILLIAVSVAIWNAEIQPLQYFGYSVALVGLLVYKGATPSTEHLKKVADTIGVHVSQRTLMWTGHAVASGGVEADLIYVQKIQNSLAELGMVKETAIRAENYMLADQTHQKMLALQLQLVKMEHQLNADIVVNAITAWQTSLADAVTRHLTNLSGFRKASLSANFPLKEKSHLNFIEVVKILPNNYYDSLIRSLLLIIPHEVPDLPKSPYGWDVFAKKIVGLGKQPPEVIDVVRSTITLSILDALLRISSLLNTSNLKRDTHELFLRHAFFYIRASAVRRLGSEFENRLFDQIMLRWSIIIGDLAVVDRGTIMRQVASILDVNRKIPSEEIIMVLSTTRYISILPRNDRDAQELAFLMHELIGHFERVKRNVVRLAVVQALERLVQPLDYTSPTANQPWEIGMHSELIELHKYARKWAGTEELRHASLRLCIVIVNNTRIEYFAQSIDPLFNDLCPGGNKKLRPHVYDCVLQLLRGRYYLDTKSNARDRVNGSFSLAASYGHLTRPVEDESPEILTERIKNFADALFIKKKGPIGMDNLDTCVEIVVQMAAHNLQVTLKLISYLLESKAVEGVAEIYFIGLRSLRIILDPDSGFINNSVGNREADFQSLISDIPYEFERKLVALLQYCDRFTNVNAIGASGVAYDPIPYSSKAAAAAAASVSRSRKVGGMATLGRSGSGGTRTVENLYGTPAGDDDILAMLSDAIDRASIKSPKSPMMGEDPNARYFEQDDISRSSGDIPRNALDVVANEGSIYNVASLNQSGTGLRTGKEGASVSLGDKAVREMNDKVAAAVAGWYRACGDPDKNIDKLRFSSALVDQAKVSRLNQDVKSDMLLILRLLKEVLRTVPLIPSPDLIGGAQFIGSYLIHSFEDVAVEASFALQRIFQNFHDMRLSIVGAFLNHIKKIPYDNDISYCTIVLHLAFLLRHWANEEDSTGNQSLDRDLVYRISCKLDACMMVMLARPNPRIRHAALSALADFYSLSETLAPHANGPGYLPLYAILVRTEGVVSKSAMYAFMERDLHGHALVPKVTSGLTLLSIHDVAISDFGVLFRFYLGELARQFAMKGRVKALRHCAKTLRRLAIPLMTSVNTVDAAFVATYSSYAVLLMSFCATPDVSEDPYAVHESQISSERLLFHQFKDYLGPILNSDNDWEINAVVASCFFVHRAMIQLFVVHLWKWFSEFSEEGPRLNPRMLDNIIHALRVISQCPEFELVIREPPAFQSSTVDIITEFIRMIEGTLIDSRFIQNGPMSSMKAAINYCTLVKRLSDSISSANVYLAKGPGADRRSSSGIDRTQTFFEQGAPGLTWDYGSRRSTIIQLKDWSLAIDASALASNGQFQALPLDVQKLMIQRSSLGIKIGMAAAALFGLGDMNEGTPMQPDTLTWMAGLEGRGFKVFTPQLLYNYENVVGTALAHSYSGKGVPQVFTNAIFDQILPRFVEGPKLFLSGKDNDTAGLEDYIASLHSLPPRDADDSDPDTSALVHPVINEDTADKLRQNVGSLIFFGLYNMLSNNKTIRNRSLLFVKELFTMFNPDPQMDVPAVFAKHTGTFYSSIGHNLKERVLELSRLAADLFPSDAPSFLWEAVRCSRSVQKAEKSPCLIPSQQFILELIVPWCRFVNLSITDDDVVFAEFFRFLMDSAFYRPKHIEQVQVCWTEVAQSEEHGQGNAEVFSEVLVQVCGKFESLREISISLLSRIFAIFPEIVADSLAYHLSSTAFPWKGTSVFQKSAPDVVAGAAFRRVRPIIREYITVLYTALNGGPPESVNDYANSCKAAIILLSELLLQNYVAVAPHFPVLLNYVIVHLPNKLQDNSVSTFLLSNMVEGYTSKLHETGNIENPEYGATLVKLRKLLACLDTSVCIVDWESDIKNTTPESQRYLRLPISEFLQILLAVFEKDYPSLSLDIARETRSWAKDGFLGPDHSVRAIETYGLLIKMHPSEVSVYILDTLTQRLVDHVSILSLIEAEFKAIDAGKTADLWSSLIETQGPLIQRTTFSGARLFHLPCKHFSKIWNMALDNARLFLMSQPREEIRINEYLLLEPFDRMKKTTSSIQQQLLKGLFVTDRAIQEKAFDLLLNSWCLLPEFVVDPSPPGLFYTILYSLTWIFVNILEDTDPFSRDGVTVDTMATTLHEILNLKSPLEFAGMIRCLQTIANGEPLPTLAVDDLLEKCTANLAQVYFPDYVNNVADFCGFAIRLGPSYGRVILKMAQVCWSLANRGQKPVGNFKTLVKKLPFVLENQEIVNALVGFVLRETADSDDFIKEIDLTSAGRVEQYPDFDHPLGSAREVAQALTDGGIVGSPYVYKWR
ncbi:hypothetical protein HK101_008306 [Irineochytrium annulatum]|nr:hypothetical protein HK101_008306 [Irineochytrium annulatum]